MTTFALVTCAHGAESVVKPQLADAGWRLAFSRPGLVTAKHDADHRVVPEGGFIRTAMTSIATVRGDHTSDMIAQAAAAIAPMRGQGLPERFDHLHVFARDRAPVGKFDFEPEPDELTQAIASEIGSRLPAATKCDSVAATKCDLIAANMPNQIADPMQTVLDVAMVDPTHWIIATHRATAAVHSRWPGGVMPITPKHRPISRAYYKAAEAIAFAGFDVQAGQRAVEIGSAPGGASGYLLERGLHVVGVDPAEMDPRIANHPRLTHHRARGGDLPRRVYADAQWMLVDSNVRPDQTLSTIENIVTHPSTSFRGVIVTLKIGGYHHVDRIDGWVNRMQTWEPKSIRWKHLARNKIEITAAITFDG